MGRRLLLYSVFCCLFYSTWGQSPGQHPPLSNLRKKNISTVLPVITVDSLSIIPGTFVIKGIPETAYILDPINSLLTWKQPIPPDSVQVVYRVFNYRLNSTVSHFNYDSISNNFLAGPEILTTTEDRRDEHFFDFGSINYNGSFGRGISFGNRQDAVVTSSLNLQLNGFLADSIEIAAAITDNNIPIQPDGTTQQLNEFDRIFLQFKKKDWQLSLGDIDLRQNNSYFLNFYKRLQGGAFETTTRLSHNVSNHFLVSGSIAKGKFTRNIFEGQEGNQGPYRLTGANNELYFTVLAGTEKVYINGELLQRGENRDYVINYNTAEVTFTPARMITKDSRIQVQFEYADRNYLNTNLYIADELTVNDRLKWRISAFNNSDAKNSAINQSLDAPQKQFLNNLGDSIRRAFYPVATIDTFMIGAIQYKKIDTLYNNGNSHDSVFVYSTSPDSARYTLSFADVGQGNADYVLDISNANGKVYKWVQPINGIKQGNFLPATFLITPKKRQVISTGFEYAIRKNTFINTEFGYSNYNINTFSTKDKADDKDYAARVQLKNIENLKGTARKLQLVTDGSYEYVGERFKPLEVLRNVEFLRDWGLPYTVTPATEQLYSAGIQLQDSSSNSLRHQFTGYHRGSRFKGFRNSIFHVQTLRSWNFNNQLQFTATNDSINKGYFLRPFLNVSKRLGWLRNYSVGASYSLEDNRQRNKYTDTLQVTSFSFETIQLFLKSPEDALNRWGLTYFTRTNKYPFGKELLTTDRSQNISLSAELLKNEHHQFRITSTYRELNVLQATVATPESDKSLLGRVEYRINAWNNLLTGNALYETGSGQEQKQDYTYLQVPDGQGQYTWIDYNNDGIQQLNEFLIASFRDQANYIKIFTPTNEFIKANYNTLNYSLLVSPRAAIDVRNANNFIKLLANVSLQSSLQLTKKEVAQDLAQLNPFSRILNDSSLISLASIFVNTFSYNRFSTKWGIDVTNSHNSSKALLTYGYESRRLDEWSAKGRYTLARAMMLTLNLTQGMNTLATSNENFGNQNYYIDLYSVEPTISYTRGTNFRIQTGYKRTNKKNREGYQENYASNSLNSEMKYNILQSSSLLAKFTYTNILFRSDASSHTELNNSTISYIILDGLLPGKNYLWNLNLTRRLSNSLEINIDYEGRKPGGARIVHTGRASVRALL